MRTLGIDHGDRRFGIALSDFGGSFARPLAVVEGEEGCLERVAELVRSEGVERIVIGLPLNMDGTVGPRALRAREFRDRVAARFGLPVDLWDERLTTFEAERLLSEAGVPRGERRQRVDMVAAQILLQSYLDARGSRGGTAS